MKPFVEVKGQTSSTSREPTRSEMKEALHRRIRLGEAHEDLKNLLAEIAYLSETCSHTVSIDTQGGPRACYGCGKSQGPV
jgi:hypothetical protein